MNSDTKTRRRPRTAILLAAMSLLLAVASMAPAGAMLGSGGMDDTDGSGMLGPVGSPDGAGSIAELPTIPTVSVTGGTATEGDWATFVFEAAPRPAAGLTVNVQWETHSSLRPGDHGIAEAGADYLATTGNVRLTRDFPIAHVQIPVYEDNVAEIDERFTLTVTEADYADVAGDGTAVGVIEGEDIVRFASSHADVVEGEEAVIEIVISPRDEPFEIDVLDRAEGANETDYDIGPYTVAVPAGASSATLRIPTHVDHANEGTEEFSLTIIEIRPDHNSHKRAEPSLVMVTIHPVTPKIVEFASAQITASEGRNARVEFEIGASDVPVTFHVLDRSEGAGEDDYQTGPYTVTAAAGESTAVLRIPVNDDAWHEHTEEFRLTITHIDTPGYAIGSPSTAIVTIQPSDRPGS